MASEQREHYRIDYPLSKRGKIIVRGSEFKVIDVSQRGIKFSIESNPNGTWVVSNSVKGSITFLVGKQRLFQGRIIRVSANDVILHLDDDIPLGLMNEEHRFIINYFKK
jgi:hypothetical protein